MQKEIVHAAISNLKPNYRSVLILRGINGFSIRETAETLNWVDLADHIHPEQGLFFSFYADAGSPYSHEVVFSKNDFSNLDGSEIFIWGYNMGEYEFKFTVNDYVSKFLVNHSMRWDGENSKEIGLSRSRSSYYK